MLTITQKTIQKFFLSIVLFFVIFNPTIISGFSFTIAAVFLSLGYIVLNYAKAIQIIRTRPIRNFIIGYLLFFLYCFFIAFIQSMIHSDFGMISSVASKFFTFSCLIIVCLGLSILFSNKAIEPPEIIDCYIYAGVLQSLCGIAAFLFPPVKSFFTSLMLKDVEAQRIWSFMISNGFRNYGWASSLYDIFGYAMSILALLALDKAIGGKRKYYVFFAMITFASVINSRTTIILIGVGMLILLLFRQKKEKRRKALKGLLILSIAVAAFFAFFANRNGSSDNSNFITDGYNSIKLLITKGEKTGYFDALFNEFLFFPQDALSIIFGAGNTPMALINRNTDVGYVQSIWSFGIVGSIMIYSLYAKLMLKAKRYQKYRSIMLANLALFFIYQIKLNSIGYSQSNVILLPIIFSIFYQEQEYDMDIISILGEV